MKAVLIEAFSDRPCAGNGAAVVLLEAPHSDGWLQALAGSLRQSETAYLLREGPDWLLRWFTPTCEVPLCGHATLASLLALGHWRELGPGEGVRFLTRSGPLEARLEAGSLVRGSIDLPGGGLLEVSPPHELTELLRRLGLGDVVRFWRSQLGYVVALLEEGAPLGDMAPIAAALEGEPARGLVLMQPQPSDPELTAGSPSSVADLPVDYRLRFFAPGLGIPEDPVTGSAHALVAPWWQHQLGRSRVVGWQCSDRPGGVVCEGLPSGKIRLIGSGHLLWDGTLHTLTLAESGPHPSGPVHGAASSTPAGPSSSAGWSALLAGA